MLEALGTELAAYDGTALVGTSCLTRGRRAALRPRGAERRGRLEVVLPSADYRERKVEPDNAAEFDELISKAAEVRTTPFAEPNHDAYLSAGEHVLDSVDVVFTVWDGQPGEGRGGTGDAVRAARDRGLPPSPPRGRAAPNGNSRPADQRGTPPSPAARTAPRPRPVYPGAGGFSAPGR